MDLCPPKDQRQVARYLGRNRRLLKDDLEGIFRLLTLPLCGARQASRNSSIIAQLDVLPQNPRMLKIRLESVDAVDGTRGWIWLRHILRVRDTSFNGS